MRPHVMVLMFVAAAGSPVGAQSIAQRVVSLGGGTLQLRFASRPGSCGDGLQYLRSGLDGGHLANRWDDQGRACEPGPARIVATVSGGRVVRLRDYVGPDRGERTDVDLGTVAASDAARFLTGLMEGDDGGVAQSAMEALVLADSIDPWPALLRVARAPTATRRVERAAAFWLGQGAAARLGVADAEEASTDDQVRAQAVFALSQQPKVTSVPQLLVVARESPHAVARARALFWLGQSGDPRALDLFAGILGLH